MSEPQMSEMTYVPADGAGGVIYVSYDADNTCKVTREAMEWLTRRAGFVEEGAVTGPEVLSDRERELMAQAWDERGKARGQYLGPDNGHYAEDCMGWEDCYCASYPNPYREPLPLPTYETADTDRDEDA